MSNGSGTKVLEPKRVIGLRKLAESLECINFAEIYDEQYIRIKTDDGRRSRVMALKPGSVKTLTVHGDNSFIEMVGFSGPFKGEVLLAFTGLVKIADSGPTFSDLGMGGIVCSVKYKEGRFRTEVVYRVRFKYIAKKL